MVIGHKHRTNAARSFLPCRMSWPWTEISLLEATNSLSSCSSIQLHNRLGIAAVIAKEQAACPPSFEIMRTPSITLSDLCPSASASACESKIKSQPCFNFRITYGTARVARSPPFCHIERQFPYDWGGGLRIFRDVCA